MAIENTTTEIIRLLPEAMAEKILFYLQAIGGIFLIYIIYSIIKFYFLRKESIAIREIQKDIKTIKRKLNIKKR